MTKKVNKAENAQGAKAAKVETIVFNDVVLNKVRAEKKAVVSAQKDYRKELQSNLEELQRMYEKDFDGCKGSIDYLCTISGCNADDFFNIDFIKTLYKTYTFKVADSDEVRTLIAEEKKVTEKTDFTKLSARVENCPFIGVSLDIEGTKFHPNKKDGGLSDGFNYWLPIVNFTASNILAHLLTLDSYVLGVAAYKKAAKAEKAKAKKAAKKAAKAEAKAEAEKAEESK